MCILALTSPQPLRRRRRACNPVTRMEETTIRGGRIARRAPCTERGAHLVITIGIVTFFMRLHGKLKGSHIHISDKASRVTKRGKQVCGDPALTEACGQLDASAPLAATTNKEWHGEGQAAPAIVHMGVWARAVQLWEALAPQLTKGPSELLVTMVPRGPFSTNPMARRGSGEVPDRPPHGAKSPSAAAPISSAVCAAYLVTAAPVRDMTSGPSAPDGTISPRPPWTWTRATRWKRRACMRPRKESHYRKPAA